MRLSRFAESTTDRPALLNLQNTDGPIADICGDLRDGLFFRIRSDHPSHLMLTERLGRGFAQCAQLGHRFVKLFALLDQFDHLPVCH